ncbi:hypothetical protein D3C81_1447010 [compost metagenome]
MPLFTLAMSSFLSQSGNTTAADFPPSSMTLGVAHCAAAERMARPVGTEPVKTICFVFELAARWAPTSLPRPQSSWTAPRGKPARSIALKRTHKPRGESSGDFTMTAFPAAKAGASDRAQMETGKFQGTICTETPIGS